MPLTVFSKVLAAYLGNNPEGAELMSNYTMFYLCQESNGYHIYYDYKEQKLYGCYNRTEDVKPCYWILLVQPFLIIGLKLLYSWMMGWELFTRRLMCIPIILILAIVLKTAWELLILNTKGTMNKKLKQLPEPTEEEWENYLYQGKVQLKRQLPFYIWMLIGMITCIGLYLWIGNVIFLFIYSVLYFIIYLFAAAFHPVRKYMLIRQLRNS